MTLQPISLDDIPATGNGNTTRHRIRQIERFLETGEEAAEVLDFGGMSAANISASLADAARRHRLAATAIRRGERVFLVRTDREWDPAGEADG